MSPMAQEPATAGSPERIVFLLHGILLNRWFCALLASFLGRRGFRVVNRSYRTTQKTIEEHAEDLRRRVEAELAPLRERGTPHELHFVTHSMGGLVVRWLLTHFPVPGVRRVVFMVPPNNGSAKARRFGRTLLYRLLYGTRAGAQLASEPPGIFSACGIPTGVEMGIIAGVAGSILTLPGRPLGGPHDGVLRLEEVCLPGVPLKKVPYGHTTILFRQGAMEEVAHFLEHGRFRPDAPTGGV
jgi:triacylglycerol lipase